MYHQAGWTPLPLEEFRLRVAGIASGPSWVIDGSYSAVRDLVWARADTVVWLDLPKRTVMRRLIWRTLRRIAGRVELWNGNRERWRNFFTWDDQESVIAWAWHTHDSRRERYATEPADPALSHLRVRAPAQSPGGAAVPAVADYAGGLGLRGAFGASQSDMATVKTAVT